MDDGRLSLDQSVTATESALAGLAADGSSAGIQAGETMTVENLLYCMLVVSANEACNILAEQVSGSVDAFVDAMNEKAAVLGARTPTSSTPTAFTTASTTPPPGICT